ncbi:MAG: galactokinase [Planctomycetota bacterium]
MTQQSHITDGAAAEPVERSVSAFEQAFGSSPQHVAFAPGRANLIGDHTDYCDGFVCPAALEIGCGCAIGPGDGTTLEIVAADLGETARIELSDATSAAALAAAAEWMTYAGGTVETVRRAFGVKPRGFRMTLASSVPTGSGLSSSAAVEVSVATAVEAMLGLQIDPVAKAELCQKAEHDFAGVPCGLMDQLTSVSGQEGSAVRIDCRDASIELVDLPDPDAAVFVLLDSAVKHSNASGAYAKRRAACEAAAKKIGVPALRDVAAGSLAGLLPGLATDEALAARHVVTENARVLDFVTAMRSGDLAEAGRLMSESHTSLSEVYKVSCEELDVLAELATAQDGVHGARMTGGGFGGWVVALVDADAAGTLVDTVAERYKAKTGKTTSSRVVVAGRGAYLVD